MGLSNSSGSARCNDHRLPPDKCFVVPPPEVDTVIPKTINLDPKSTLGAMSYIADTLLAGNTTPENSPIIQDLAAYVEGINITVIFYHQINNTTYQMTSAVDFSESIDPVHLSYLKINAFQLKLQDGLDFSYEGNTSQVIGEATVFPYFNPNVGDLFLYTVSPGRLGMFRIVETPTRLTINAATYHKIKFVLDRIFTDGNDPLIQRLNLCVAREAYFNLKRFIIGEGALLSTDEHNTIALSTAAINTLTHYYGDEFYDTQMYRTFVDDPQLYDPYLVEFAASIFDMGKLPGFPMQLRSNPPHWKRTFWFKLLYPGHVPDSTLINTCYRVLQTATYRTVGVNALTNRCFIAIEPTGKHPYPPFPIPEVYDETTATLPMQIKLYFEHNKIKPMVVLRLAQDVLLYSRRAQFYYIPIIVYLLKQTIKALTAGSDIVLGVDSTQEPTGSTNNCTTCVYNASPSHVLGVCASTQPPGPPYDGQSNNQPVDGCVPCSIHADITADELDRRCHWHLQHTHHHRNNSPVCVTDELDVFEE